jgi:hypothetical protein
VNHPRFASPLVTYTYDNAGQLSTINGNIRAQWSANGLPYQLFGENAQNRLAYGYDADLSRVVELSQTGNAFEPGSRTKTTYFMAPGRFEWVDETTFSRTLSSSETSVNRTISLRITFAGPHGPVATLKRVIATGVQLRAAATNPSAAENVLPRVTGALGASVLTYLFTDHLGSVTAQYDGLTTQPTTEYRKRGVARLP